MARWHFSIFLVPQDWAQENKGSVDHYLTSGWDLKPAWAGFDMPLDFYPEFMSASHDWSVDLLHWTTTQPDNNIYIGLTEEDIEYFQIQIDMRAGASDMLSAISDYAQSQKLGILLMEEKRIIRPEKNQLTRAARNSRACNRFHDRRE